jgi:hypothetical protein
MAGRQNGERRGDLAKLAGRFAHWRGTHAYGARIPDSLWQAAIDVAGQYGVSRTATTLKLGYYDLQKRVAAKKTTERLKEGSSSAFLEISPASLGAVCDWTIELERCDGARMRIEVKAASQPDLAALSRSFWDSA